MFFGQGSNGYAILSDDFTSDALQAFGQETRVVKNHKVGVTVGINKTRCSVQARAVDDKLVFGGNSFRSSVHVDQGNPISVNYDVGWEFFLPTTAVNQFYVLNQCAQVSTPYRLSRFSQIF